MLFSGSVTFLICLAIYPYIREAVSEFSGEGSGKSQAENECRILRFRKVILLSVFFDSLIDSETKVHHFFLYM